MHLVPDGAMFVMIKPAPDTMNKVAKWFYTTHAWDVAFDEIAEQELWFSRSKEACRHLKLYKDHRSSRRREENALHVAVGDYLHFELGGVE